jgi:hypothetical protein
MPNSPPLRAASSSAGPSSRFVGERWSTKAARFWPRGVEPVFGIKCLAANAVWRVRLKFTNRASRILIDRTGQLVPGSVFSRPPRPPKKLKFERQIRSICCRRPTISGRWRSFNCAVATALKTAAKSATASVTWRPRRRLDRMNQQLAPCSTPSRYGPPAITAITSPPRQRHRASAGLRR